MESRICQHAGHKKRTAARQRYGGDVSSRFVQRQSPRSWRAGSMKAGERVLFHVRNASATDDVPLALPRHDFNVIALDGNPVPNPRAVPILVLAPAERIDAIVEMKQPGVWVFGATDDSMREMGMGVVVEYAGQSGAPQWSKPPSSNWDYTVFGTNTPSPEPD